ncbi:MAG: HNH endonuclease [Bacteroidetes bacterium]|nr:HNH endonuclease [Bacteroidota bacterium]
MSTIVRKEQRLKTFPAWHRLLFRSADIASKDGLLSHPKDTVRLLGARQWMLTERGIDKALKLSGIPIEQKSELPVVTYEVERVKKEIEAGKRQKDYDPIDNRKKPKAITRESLLRRRGFRQAVIETYDYSCSICGLKVSSPKSLLWEVEAAHIVPHRLSGKDDIWNGIALCHFHHWCFDVGWFALTPDYAIEVNSRLSELPVDYGVMRELDILRGSIKSNQKISLPRRQNDYPHENAILWHRKNIFMKGAV